MHSRRTHTHTQNAGTERNKTHKPLCYCLLYNYRRTHTILRCLFLTGAGNFFAKNIWKYRERETRLKYFHLFSISNAKHSSHPQNTLGLRLNRLIFWHEVETECYCLSLLPHLYLPWGFRIRVSLYPTAEFLLHIVCSALPRYAPLCPSPHFSPFLPLLSSPESGITCSAQVGLVVMGMHDWQSEEKDPRKRLTRKKTGAEQAQESLGRGRETAHNFKGFPWPWWAFLKGGNQYGLKV